MMHLYRITAPHFCAGMIVSLPGIVLHAAPIIAWTKGKSVAELFRYCHRKRWHMELVQEAGL
jgi:hypothetical protein